MNEAPIVRFAANSTAPDRLTQRLASYVQDYIDRYVRLNDSPVFELIVLCHSYPLG